MTYVGYVSPNRACGFIFQSFINGGSSVLHSIGDKTNPEAPNIILLGGSIQLDCQNIFMECCKSGKNRFCENSLFIDQTKIGIIDEYNNLFPLICLPGNQFNNAFNFTDKRS